MAITPSQWSHVLTIPESYTPSAATSGQTLVITESVIAKLSASDQSKFWSNVQNGGGDVRICENSDGTNQLPVEVVNLDNSAQTCVIWTRKPTYNGAGSLYLFIGKAGETQPPVTDPFGRNAVWQDWDRALTYYLTDASGNGDFSTASGTPQDEDGNVRLNGASASTLISLAGQDSAYLSFFLTMDSESFNAEIFSVGDNGPLFLYNRSTSSNELGLEKDNIGGDPRADNNFIYTVGQRHFVQCKYEQGGLVSLTVDGATYSASDSGTFKEFGSDIIIGSNSLNILLEQLKFTVTPPNLRLHSHRIQQPKRPSEFLWHTYDCDYWWRRGCHNRRCDSTTKLNGNR